MIDPVITTTTKMVGHEIIKDMIQNLGALFGRHDVLDIPQTYDKLFTVILGISWIILLLCLTIEVVSENIKGVRERDYIPDFRKILVNFVLIVIGLSFYKFLYLKILSINEAIAMSLVNVNDVFQLITKLLSNIVADDTIFNIFKFKIFDFVYLICSTIFVFVAVIIEEILLVFRYVILSILFIFGPLAFAFSIFSGLKNMLKGWFINLFQISFWIIILRIIENIFVSFTDTASSFGQLEGLLISIVFIGCIVCIPIITSKFLSGDNLGAVGTLAIAGISTIVGKAISISGFASKISKISNISSFGKSSNSSSSGGSGSGGSGSGGSGYRNNQNKEKKDAERTR